MRPFGFWSATSLPNAMALLACWGRSACASKCETCKNAWVASASSRSKRKVSAGRPEGPGAAPFRVRRRALMIKASGNWRGSAGTNCMIAGSMGAWGAAGRLVASQSSLSVDASPGARGPAVNAWRAADNSPW